MSKTIFDPIHGNIMIDPIIRQIIDTPEYQRLREIKQLGSCYHVFPGASHNRFEHSIGVSHLVGYELETIKRKQPELNITDRQVLLMKVAGLCHDLGHGCFSHAFEDTFLKKIFKSKIPKKLILLQHEYRSCMVIQYIIKKYNIDINDDEIYIVQKLIEPDQDCHGFMFQILANNVNGLDCDKYDYIARDTQSLGITGFNVNFNRLIESCRVIDDMICYPDKEIFNIYELFRARYRLHKQVYTHHGVQQIEFMISDILALVDEEMMISDRIFDAEKFCTITDNILTLIEYHDSTSDNFIKAKALIQRIKRRDLYKFVGEKNFKSIHINFSEKNFIQYDTSLIESDIMVYCMKIGYTGKGIDPVDNIYFYGKDCNIKFKADKEQMGGLLPPNFDENIVRVFCRNNDKYDIIKSAFNLMFTN